MAVMRHLTVDGTTYDTVGEASVTQVVSSGTKVATVTIDGTATDIYAPSGGGNSTFYGTCSTDQSTQVKQVTCEGFALTGNPFIAIYFTTANIYSEPRLNINSTGEVRIRVGDTVPFASSSPLKWAAYTVLYFIYDGEFFRYLGSMSSSSVQNPEGAGNWLAKSSTAATTAAKSASCQGYRKTDGAIVAVKFSNANTKTDSALTLEVNSTGAETIYKGGAATSSSNTLTWSAGATCLFLLNNDNYYYLGSDMDTGGGGGGVSMSTTTATIGTTGWSGNQLTVSVTGVTASNAVIVAPAPASMSAWASAGIYCSAQGAGTLTFTCSTVPSASLTANVMILE